MRKMTLMVAACTVLALSPAVRAADFGPSDQYQIVDTARHQEIRFKRDYKGKIFAAPGQVKSISEGWSGRVNVAVRVAGEEVNCWVNKVDAKDLADMDAGRRVQVTGEIRDTVFGDLQVDNCRLN